MAFLYALAACIAYILAHLFLSSSFDCQRVDAGLALILVCAGFISAAVIEVVEWISTRKS